MKSISAIQLHNKPELIVDEIDIADPTGKQVMVKLISSGICHSQLHQMHDNNLPKPFHSGLLMIYIFRHNIFDPFHLLKKVRHNTLLFL